MKVIFLKDVPGSGKRGEVKEVSDGYARNYLIRNRLAEAANAGVLTSLQLHQKSVQKKAERQQKEYEGLAKKIEGRKLVLTRKVSEQGTLYGAIHPEEIARGLAEQLGVKVDKNFIHLPEAIKRATSYPLEISFGPTVKAHLTLHVTPE